MSQRDAASIGLFASLFVGFVGCSPAEDAPLTYCEIEPIVSDKCLPCHAEIPLDGVPFSLASYEQLYSERVGAERAIRTGFMPLTSFDGVSPPAETLTEDERAHLLEWLEAGAPSGGCE